MPPHDTPAPIEPGASVAVIGTGIVGVCTAIYLKRAGFKVTVYDPGGPAAGASFGNAGLISPDSCIPIAMPGMLTKLPGWLMRADGPLALDKRHAVRAAPWLLRFLRAGSPPKVLHSARALRALHAPAFDTYRDLLGVAAFEDLIRLSGTIQVWDDRTGNQTTDLVRQIWAENGVTAQTLGRDDLRQLVPELSQEMRGGLFFPNNGMTVNPKRLVEALFEVFQVLGGAMLRERVMKIVPEAAGSLRLISNHGDRKFNSVVVAAGAYSGELLAPLGIAPPLDTERGYHAMIADPGIEVRIPLLHKGMGVGVTPMEAGLRLAGTVEIAGLRKPPDERRAAVLLNHARKLFPKIRTETMTMWMGFRPSIPDSLPVIAAARRYPGLYLAFGHGHFGMTGGPATGRAVAALVAGHKPQIDLAPYSADRFRKPRRSGAGDHDRQD